MRVTHPTGQRAGRPLYAGLAGAAILSLITAAAVRAAPSPSSVTVGVGGAAPAQATVNGGPITGQGDNGLGQPLNPCPSPACESFGITLQAPAGYAAGNVIRLAVSVATTTPVPPNPQAGTLDTYLEDSSGAVVSSDPNSQNPSTVADNDAQPGSYTLVVAGSTGADNSYVATVTTASTPRVTAGIPNDITFAPSTVVSPVVLGGEPQVTLERPQANSLAGAVDSNRGFVDWPLSSRTNIGTLWRTTNGGDSFRQIYDTTCAQRQRPNCQTGGGGDTVNRVNLYDGHVLFGDQESLAAEAYAQSGDHGDTFPPTQQTPITAGGTAVDRQWIAPVSGPGYTAGPTDQYPLEGIFSYHIPVDGIYVSGIDTSGVVHPAVLTQVNAVDQSGDSVVDTTGGPGDGWLYLSYRQAIVSTQATGYLVATVPVSQFETPGISPTGAYHVNLVNSDIPEVFPWIALDTHGNAYATWVTGGKVYLAYSLIDDRHNNPHLGGVPGTLWTTKVQVNPTVLGSTLFPEIVAGDPGHVAITYVGTAGFTGVADNAVGANWYTFTSISTDALDASPTFVTGPVSHRVVHTGTLCTSGTTCATSNGDRSLLDMIDISMDADGRVGVVYSNNNNLFARQELSSSGSLGSEGSPYVMFAKLASGPSLLNGHGPYAFSYPQQCRSAPGGDATWPNHLTGASNIPGLDVLGDCVYTDANGNLVARVDLADASHQGMVNALGAYNGVLTTDLPAQRIQYVVRFETANDVGYMAFDVNSAGVESSYGGIIDQNNQIIAAGNAVGTLYNAQSGFTVSATRAGNSLLLSAPMAQFAVNNGMTLDSVTAFTDAGPADTSVGGVTSTDGTILNTDRVVDSSPPLDVVAEPLQPQATTPEAPYVILLPLIGLAIGGVLIQRRRRVAGPR